MRQKAVEARVAEEARKQQLLQEQQDLKEREAAWKESQAQSVANTQNPVSMPGLFPNSPDHKSLGNSVGTGGDDQVIRKPRGFLHDIGKRFGFEHGRRPDVSNLGGGNTSGGSNGIFDSDSPPPYSIDDKNKSPAPETATAPHRLQQNLVNAVESSRAYNSTSLVSQPTVNEVKETATYCDAKPSHNLKFVAESSSGVKMFFANDTEDQSFLAANGSALNAFSSILLDCAHVFNLGKHAVHIFYDNNGSTIAFNKSKVRNGRLTPNSINNRNLTCARLFSATTDTLRTSIYPWCSRESKRMRWYIGLWSYATSWHTTLSKVCPVLLQGYWTSH